MKAQENNIFTARVLCCY